MKKYIINMKFSDGRHSYEKSGEVIANKGAHRAKNDAGNDGRCSPLQPEQGQKQGTEDQKREDRKSSVPIKERGERHQDETPARVLV